MDFPLFRQPGSEAKADFPYLALSLGFSALVWCLETYLMLRQLRKFREEKVPEDLLDVVKKVDQQQKGSGETLVDKVNAKFAKAQAYGRDKGRFSIFESGLNEIQSLLLMLGGSWPWLWDASTAICGRTGLGAGEIAVSLVFAALLSVTSTLLALPSGAYFSFVIEERHGFNKQTAVLFVMDKVKSLLLSFVIGGPLLAGLLWVLRWAGPSTTACLYLWAFVCSVSVVLMVVYPTFIAPLFNKYTALEDGDLKTCIEALAERLKFPLTKLFVVDGSKRSAHSNAYFYGFLKSKRIVLFDTLLQQATTPEILAILGHECGHWSLNHTVQGFVVSQAYMLAAFYSFGLAADRRSALCASFGFATAPDLVWLALFFGTLWTPVDHVLTCVMNFWSRHNEFEADAFSVDLGYASDLQLGLVKLHLENLGNMSVDPWYSAYHYSHPPLVARLRAIADADKAAAKKRT